MTSACFPAESDERPDRGSLAPTPVRPFVSPFTIIAAAFDRHEFLAGAILFLILGLLSAIGSLAVAVGIALPCSVACIIADRWTALQEARNAERDRQCTEWGEAEFDRLVAQLSLAAMAMRSVDEQPERRAA